MAKLGKPLPPISDEYAEPPPDENAQATLIALWNQHAPKKYRGMMAAQSKTVLDATGEQPRGAWIWDDVKREYINVKTGEIVTVRQAQEIVRRFTESFVNA